MKNDNTLEKGLRKVVQAGVNGEILKITSYALANKDSLFVKKKSLDSLHGTIGFRTGTPKLKTLKGFTWNTVTNLLKEFLPAYVRIAEEPAKDKLLTERNNEQIADFFPKIGVVVTQDETFFVEVKA